MAKPLQHQIIARALEIISDESKWTRGSLARLADGTACACLNPHAVRFCAVGALNRAAGELVSSTAFQHALEAEQFVLEANSEHEGLPSINDTDGRTVVMAMFKVALGERPARWW